MFRSGVRLVSMLETTKGTVWFRREMTNCCKKVFHLVAEKRYETLHPVVKLVVAEGHCVKVEKAVEPALHNNQLQ